MSPKITSDKPLNRKAIRSAQEKKQFRVVLIGFIITALLIVGFVGYAVLYDLVLKNRIPVAVVNGVSIDNKYFEDRVRLERNSYVQQFNLIYAQYQLLAEDPTTAEYYQSQLVQVQQILDNTESFANVVLNKIVDEEILAQKAAELGLSVSDAEVEEAMQGLFRFYPSGTPTPAPTFPPVSTPTPSRDQLNLLNYTATPTTTGPEVTEEGVNEQPETTPAVEGDTDDAETPATEEAEVVTPTVTPTQEITATATLYTEEMFQEEYQGYISDLKEINVEEASLRKYLRSFLLVQKVREQIVNEVTREQEQVWARHILVQTMPEALIVMDRIDKGEDWATIAADVSLDTSNKDRGGDLGWFARGRMVEPFELAAFALEPGEISDPVETQFGVHLIQVIGKDTLPLSDSEFESLQEIRYQEWFQEIRGAAEIKINDVWQELAPKEPTYRLF